MQVAAASIRAESSLHTLKEAQMKKWTSVLAVLTVALTITGAAYAAGDKKADDKSSLPSASPTMSSSSDFTGRHTMEGDVTSVDAKKGHLTLKTAEGSMTLHFPPAALENVKKGDHVAVELALKPSGSASSGSMAPAASPSTGSRDKKY
jgi:hypothetical protein